MDILRRFPRKTSAHEKMNKLGKLLLAGSIILGMTACSSGGTEEDTGEPVVEVTGTIRGYVDDNGVRTYKGIPYAATTEGENRFKDPQPVEPREGELDCTEYGPIVMQNEAEPFMCWSAEYVDGGMTYENGKMSEDSLNLNVWTQGKKGDDLPVIVYIHGGANTSGSGENEVYTGEKIAQKGVVYVTFNYRVGLFGFLSYVDETGEEITGNFAIKDQIAALQWVQDNIEQFGGDPGNVTIAGQSAGSQDVQKLMISPKAEGLFCRAVAMSANGYEGFGPMGSISKEDAQAEAKQFLGDYTVEQLRSMSTQEVDKLREIYNPSTHIIDGEYLTGTQKDAYASGEFNHVDFMTGCVTGDTVLFGGFINLPEGEEKWAKELYKAVVEEELGDKADEFLKLYPADENVTETVAQIAIDNANVQCAYAIAQKDANDSENKSYQWYFSRSVPDKDPETEKMWGSFHTGDVGYWLNYFSTTSERPWTDADYKLGDLMSDYLINFAKTGDPNGEGLPEWKAADESISYMHLDEDSEFEELDEKKTEFWLDYYVLFNKKEALQLLI